MKLIKKLIKLHLYIDTCNIKYYNTFVFIMSLLKSIETMPARDIEDILKNNRYIPASTKIVLEERLAILKKEKKVQIDFPTILLDDETIPQIPCDESTYFDQIMKDKKDNSIFESNKLMLDYAIIKEFIDNTVAIKIKIMYYDLIRKNQILNAVRLSKNKRWNKIKKVFEFEKSIEEEQNYRHIIEICNHLNRILYIIDSIDDNVSCIQELKSITFSMNYDRNIFCELINDIENLYLNISRLRVEDDRQIFLDLSDYTEKLLTTITFYFSPNIECIYIANITKQDMPEDISNDSENENERNTIDLICIIYKNIIYTKNQTKSQYIFDFHDSQLYDASIEEVKNMLMNNKKYIHLPNNFLFIHNFELHNDKRAPILRIYYEIYEENNNDEDIYFLNIMNMPPQSRYITSMIKLNIRQLNENFKTINNTSFDINSYIQKSWLQDTYSDLSTSSTNITDNQKAVDYIFEELLRSAEANGLILPEMRESFTQLAFENSI
jgi:hypothetical protein